METINVREFALLAEDNFFLVFIGAYLGTSKIFKGETDSLIWVCVPFLIGALIFSLANLCLFLTNRRICEKFGSDDCNYAKHKCYAKQHLWWSLISLIGTVLGMIFTGGDNIIESIVQAIIFVTLCMLWLVGSSWMRRYLEKNYCCNLWREN
ncbi:MAG: hypothetical protein FWG34_13175 [Oscillospiraceae bacterium]|nr:hypothetical protein [Oscillospiraceae bacterium]